MLLLVATCLSSQVVTIDTTKDDLHVYTVTNFSNSTVGQEIPSEVYELENLYTLYSNGDKIYVNGELVGRFIVQDGSGSTDTQVTEFMPLGTLTDCRSFNTLPGFTLDVKGSVDTLPLSGEYWVRDVTDMSEMEESSSPKFNKVDMFLASRAQSLSTSDRYFAETLLDDFYKFLLSDIGKKIGDVVDVIINGGCREERKFWAEYGKERFLDDLESVNELTK